MIINEGRKKKKDAIIIDDKMESEKRRVKPTAKAWAIKIEKLQHERKITVDKMKSLIPEIKSLMRTRENVVHVQSCFEKLNQLCESAIASHDVLIPLLMEDEQNRQNEWFYSIMKYNNTFKEDVERWLSGSEDLQQNSSLHLPQSVSAVKTEEMLHYPTEDAQLKASSQQDTEEMQDEIKPSDSVSNVENKTSVTGRKSAVSSTSSARLKAEADLAALMARQRLLKEKHELEEQEEYLKRKKEQLQMDEDIAAHMAKLNVLRSQSITSVKKSTTKHSDGMESYFKRGTSKQRTLNAEANSFIPQPSVKQKETKQEPLDPGTRPKRKSTPQYLNYEPRGHSMNHNINTEVPHRSSLNGGSELRDEQYNNMLGIMRKQNEITTLLVQQQCLSSLPKREIPIFDGSPLNYHSFIKAFENGVERNTDNNSDRLYFLEQYTRGHAKELVKSCQHLNPDRGYLKAKALLREHFGNEQKVASAYMERALSWSPIKTEDLKALQDYSLFLRSCSNAMEGVDYLHELNMPANMLTIIKKLPYKFRDKWRTEACELQEKCRRRATFSDITDFIEKQVKILSDPIFGNIQDSHLMINRSTSKPKLQPHFGIRGTSFATTMAPLETKSPPATECKKQNSRTCLCCGGGHILDVCPQMEKKTHKEKIGFLRDKSICFGCLCIGHFSKDCKKRISCAMCGLQHPNILHIPQKKNNPSQAEKTHASLDSTMVSSGLTGAGNDNVKLPIVPVQVKSNKGDKIVTTYAFLDQGSTAVFCTEALSHKLGLTGKKSRILLRTMGQEKVVSSYVVSGLEVAGLQSDSFCELPKTYTQQHMPVHKGNIPRNADLQRWTYLESVQLPEIDADIELLIGANVPQALEPLEIINSVDGGPYAIRTKLGWTVNGPLRRESEEATDYDNLEISVNRVSVVELEELWQQQFKTDFPESEMDEQVGMSREDQRFMELVINSAKHVNGHYQISLPLKNKQVKMSNNRKIVEQRASYLKKRFQKSPSFHADYIAFMNDLIAKGYAERVPEDNLQRSDGKVWYIPHHGVYHPVKKKIRVVFDCGASFQGTSLNDQLLQGPDLTNALIGVLTRFRKETVVIMADVESMFHQVKVPDEDSDLLRFVWWPDGDFNQELTDFRMTVHLFGATSSPSCANFALRKCAEDNKPYFNQDVVDKVLHCFYVDDCLVSVASEEKAISLCYDLISICAKGGFKLTKWISNREKVIAAIPEEHRAKEVKSLDLDQGQQLVERVLGVEWCIRSDSFRFRIMIKNRPFTRRGILSTLSSIYDPLGILSPVVLPAKKLLRDLCRKALGWDDTIPDSIAEKWRSWLQELCQLDDFKIMRCLKPSGFGETTMAQLHHFCDASEDGYGVVSYLLSHNARSQVHVAFIMGKARVAPLKSITIPRMELIAATMSSRIDVLWRRELHMDLQESVFWTDSTSVLKYIRNETSRFKVFVANRVSEILKASQYAQWRYVDTTHNPADAASRGLKVNTFLRNKTWVSGPQFLTQPESVWPVNLEDVYQLPADDPEVKELVAVNAVQTEEADPVTRMIHYFSSWTNLKKSIAWILRWKRLLLLCCQKRRELKLDPTQSSLNLLQMCSSEAFKENTVSKCLSVEELEEAELEIIKFSQKQMFPEEIFRLQSGKTVRGCSHLYKLCPLFKDGVLRVGGRLSRSSMPAESKHPIILANSFHISDVLLRHIHHKVGHGGRNHMLAKLREKYWITGASTAIRRILSKCVICRRLNAQPVSQQMADLPIGRVTPDEPPFTRVGVDCFGPFEVKSRRSVVKRYGVIFTCLAIRAVHIEVAASLDTDSFINALRRFIARRGQVLELYSDNGTNFVGAERELKTAIEQWNHSKINNMLLQKGIKWSFNPPTGSHHGGSWERLIRSVRKVLNSTLKVQNLDEDGLHTVLCEVESIINSRPITKATTDPNDLEALTPNHLLVMKTVPSLPPGDFQEADVYARRRWKQVQYMSDLFWKRWIREYLPLLQERQKWSEVKRNVMPGDVVIVMDSSAPRSSWIMGRVLQTFPDRRGFVRQVRIKTKSGCLDRPITKICLLQEEDAG